MAKQKLPFGRRKRRSFAHTFTGSLSQPQESGWEEAQKLWRHKNTKRHNTRAKASWWKGFSDFAIKVKLRTKTSTKSFINAKRTGVLWKHTNTIHNPTLATSTDAQVLLEARVQTLFLKYSLQYDTTQRARPQAQGMSLSLKFRYTRKLLHLPRCRGDSAAFDATRHFGLKLPKDFKLQHGNTQAYTYTRT